MIVKVLKMRGTTDSEYAELVNNINIALNKFSNKETTITQYNHYLDINNNLLDSRNLTLGYRIKDTKESSLILELDMLNDGKLYQVVNLLDSDSDTYVEVKSV